MYQIKTMSNPIPVFDFLLHKTTHEYRTGLRAIFEHMLTALQTCSFQQEVQKSELLKINNKLVFRFEKESSEEEYRLGLYAAAGWFLHVMNHLETIKQIDAAEIVKQLETIIQDIKTAGTK
jgi:hypothetical protein